MGPPKENHAAQIAALDALDVLTGGSIEQPERWPAPMRQEAFYGPAGDFVRLVLPETEADPHALLLALLAGIGCIMGRQSWYQVGSTRHHPNLFTAIVGDSAKARKGTATDCVMHFLKQIDPQFMRTQRVSGLSSGEGLISAVRDARSDSDAPESGARDKAASDPGMADKRLLVVEAELSHALQTAKRDGSTLSPIIRNAWDGNALRVLSRSNRDACEEPHIAVISNITVEEVRVQLALNDRLNGFANRFLWCCARRSKYLPFGGESEPSGYHSLVSRFRAAVAASRTIGRLVWSEEAKVPWSAVYTELGTNESGASEQLAALTSRADAQCVRLAMLYALLDGSQTIKIQHLEAAIAVWEYCEDSVKHIFASGVGDRTQEKILQALSERAEGMSRTEISRRLGGHAKAHELDDALEALMQAGRVDKRVQQTAGPPCSLYRLKKPA